MAPARRRQVAGDVNATVGVLLVALILILANYVAARHYRRLDWTKTQVYSLSDRTRQVLKGLTQPVQVTVVEIPDAAVSAGDVYSAIRELLERFRSVSPLIKVEYLDPIRDPERAKILLAKYRITNFDVQTGVVIFDNGSQSKYVTQDEIVEYDLSGMRRGQGRRMKAFKGEQAFLSALLTIAEKPKQLCFIKGHLEADIESFERTGYSTLSDELRREAFKTRAFEKMAKVPDGCDAIVVGGPQKAWLPPEVEALEAYLKKGGRAILLLGPVFDWGPKKFRRIGVEEVVERRGVRLGQNVVIDPSQMLPLGRLMWRTAQYGDHPVTTRMTDAPTSWPLTREVRPGGKTGTTVTPLVLTSAAGWGETDLAAFAQDGDPRFDEGPDAKGPVPVAVAIEEPPVGTRMVVFGSSAFVSNSLLDLEADFNGDLFMNAASWVTGRTRTLGGVGPKATEHVKLSINESQLWSIGLIAVLLMPLGAALLGAAVWWLRRS